MEATPETEQEAIAKVDAMAEAVTKDNRVILAHRLMAPLMCEAEAISAYIAETRQDVLRNALPEVTSLAEAISLASVDYRLTKEQQASLKQVLARTGRLTSARPPKPTPNE
jgi:hypothetical protein